ncbi:outer membrane protein [Vibrio marisflavi]|nr:outer membrane beta-barrel protein [Vibrio marisflavi]
MRLRKTIKLILWMVIVGLSGTQVATASGFYATGSLGFAVQKPPSEGSSSIGSASDVSGRIAAGYLHTINDKWAAGVELGYSHFGTGTFYKDPTTKLPAKSTITLKSYATDISVVANYKLNPQWTLIGKGGVADMRSDANADSTLYNHHVETQYYEHDVKPVIGFGARYQLDENVSVESSLTHYFGDTSLDSTNPSNVVPIVNQLLVGIHYAFN